jgi:hypothetical protein
MQFGALIFMTITLALSAQATTYSKASLKGSYSFLTNLWTANASTSEFAMLGVLAFNGAGKVNGSYTSVTAGVTQTGTLAGTYTVSSNGTGTITFTTGSTAKFAIALDSPTTAGVAQGTQLLQINDTNSVIVSGTAVLQSTTTETYSVASLKGNFGYQGSDWTADPTQNQDGELGVISFDGKGNFKVSETRMKGGVLESGSNTGTYTVNADGSGTLTITKSGQTACVLNSVSAGQAGGLQCLDVDEGSNTIHSYIALKQ